ncbi:MAG: DMT family transporter [Rhodospirillales bacterium]|nr:DMT family transporter [Rhodospirillales bacterium]QQS12226.1 MAG: DMT family transporter [Rhodospirillales bacterium]
MTTFLTRFAPTLFALLWSTGWISARFGADHAEPLTFLSFRHAFSAIALAALCVLLGARWPRTAREVGHAFASGLLLHAIHLGGVWWAIAHGVPAGISGLIAALQPILTALLAPALIGERIGRAQWIGVVLGFAGIGLVLWPKLAGPVAGDLAAVATPIAINAGGMLAATLGAFYQKRFLARSDLLSTQTLQFTSAFIFTLPVALAVESFRIEWNTTIVATMAWSVLGMSIGASCLLLLLIRHGAVSRAAALMYLMPPLVAVEAFLLFDERLSAAQLAGMAVTVVGVALATRR